MIRCGRKGEEVRVVRVTGQSRLQSVEDDALLVLGGVSGWMNAASARYNAARWGLVVVR